MKQGVSIEAKAKVLDLRRRYSIREVADQTGLPVGTVKTICSRSGAFRDNERLRAMCSLPPIRVSAETLPAAPTLPQQQKVTGDGEIDAVLWLRECISTGQAVMIDLAMQQVKKIKTPLGELEERYRKLVVRANPGNLFAAMNTFGFADLEMLAEKSKKKAALRHEAYSRFGDRVFEPTAAEQYCIDTLNGVGLDRYGFIDDEAAAERFRADPDMLPNTLADCLHEMRYWDELSSLRYAFGTTDGDPPQEVSARRSFLFSCMATIRPRSKDESLQVLRWMIEDKQNRFDRTHTDAILLNLIG